MHTHVHVYEHNTHARTNTCIHTHTHTHTHTYTHTNFPDESSFKIPVQLQMYPGCRFIKKLKLIDVKM